MELIKNYATNNMHYKNNVSIPVKMLVLHSVGCAQPSPEVFCKTWNSGTSQYPAHIVIGTEKAYEVLPCTQTKGKTIKCWHVGNANAYSIGAEMTEPATIKYTGGATWTDLNPTKTKEHVLTTYKNAVDIFAQLCKFHGLDPLKDGVILSHSECCKRGIGTNHGDVEHMWNKFGLTMDQFRKDVKSKIENTTESIKPTTDTSEYRVKILADVLNVRTGPGMNYRIISTIKDHGVYTIIETNGNWGKLKSKLGWISLSPSYVKKL